MAIQRLTTGEGPRLRAIRLRALLESPDAFATRYEDAESMSPEHWSSQLEQIPAFVATRAGSDVGLVRVVRGEDDPDMAHLISLWVAPEHRRAGIGAQLVDAVVDWARSSGLSRVGLDVGDDNAAAIALYAAKGLVPNGEVGRMPPPREGVREHRRILTIHTGSRPRESIGDVAADIESPVTTPDS